MKTVSGGDKLEDGASLETQLTVWEENRRPDLFVRGETKGQMKTVLIVKHAAQNLNPGGTLPLRKISGGDLEVKFQKQQREVTVWRKNCCSDNCFRRKQKIKGLSWRKNSPCTWRIQN